MQGATLKAFVLSVWAELFQSTPPMQGATELFKPVNKIRGFQSTPPMQGATAKAVADLNSKLGFNPRPLCRERHSRENKVVKYLAFQSTPPMQGAT